MRHSQLTAKLSNLACSDPVANEHTAVGALVIPEQLLHHRESGKQHLRRGRSPLRRTPPSNPVLIQAGVHRIHLLGLQRAKRTLFISGRSRTICGEQCPDAQQAVTVLLQEVKSKFARNLPAVNCCPRGSTNRMASISCTHQ